MTTKRDSLYNNKTFDAKDYTTNKQVLKVTEQELIPITVDDITYHCLSTGFSGYFVSTSGHIISYHTKGHLTPSGKLKSSKPRLLKPYATNIGYYQVSLYNQQRNGRVQLYVHQIVANAFLQRPEGIDATQRLQINHINGIKADNGVSNLEFCTHRENSIHYHKVLKPLHSSKEL